MRKKGICCKLGPRDLSIAVAVDHLNTHITGLDPTRIVDYACILFPYRWGDVLFKESY